MLQPPFNNLLLHIREIWVKQYGAITKTSAMHAHGANVNPADMVNIVGEVAAIPSAITEEKLGYKGFSTKDIQVGDTAIYRYDVIYSFTGDKSRWKNLFYYRKKEYWVADIHKIFAVIRKGEIIMINGYCMVEHYSNPSNIILPKHLQNVEEIGRAELAYIGNNLTHLNNVDAKRGDIVLYNPRILQKYEIGKQKFGIIRQSDIFGVERASI